MHLPKSCRSVIYLKVEATLHYLSSSASFSSVRESNRSAAGTSFYLAADNIVLDRLRVGL